jgi:thiamine-phosphate pyrophosphorylase
MLIVAVTDRKQSVRPLPEQARLIASAGADMVVLREKDLPDEELVPLAESIKKDCDKYGTRFCIDGSVSVARAVGTDTLWMPFRAFASGRPEFDTVGTSIHSEKEGLEAERLGADFLVYGNVFETTCKPGKPAKGLAEMKRLIEKVCIPVYAIGGISHENITEVRDAGASGACLMSGLMKAKDPALAIENLRRNLRYG